MKRFHVNVGVADLDKSIQFYSTLFGEEPEVVKPDYAKWMLEDPRVNFAINLSSAATGINHVGLQADTMDELGEIQERLRSAGNQTLEQPDAECCYARSSKTWVRDPDSVAWETFVTHDSITHYGDAVSFEDVSQAKGSRCCA
jgi:catechol 2,3-dioxygenase-like lactoylglutathione lyase family enzyme